MSEPIDLDMIRARCERATEGPWLAFTAENGRPLVESPSRDRDE